MQKIEVTIPEEFGKYINSASLRFQYLYPDVTISISNANISIEGGEEGLLNNLRQELLHLVYKEKIYSETLEIRKSIYRAISDE